MSAYAFEVIGRVRALLATARSRPARWRQERKFERSDGERTTEFARIRIGLSQCIAQRRQARTKNQETDSYFRVVALLHRQKEAKWAFLMLRGIQHCVELS